MLSPLLVTLLASGVLGITFKDHGYEDILVTISPDLPFDQADTIIENIQHWVRNGSETLYSSSMGWAFIRNVIIWIPQNWPDNITDKFVDGIVYEDGNIRVNTPSGVYGNSPFTVQLGSCGEPGEYIQASSEFLEDINNMEATFGPLGQVFVHEWAKFRYGVFEEHGYPGDEKYPMFYYNTKWTIDGQVNVIAPSFCINNPDLDYKMVDYKTGGDCTYDKSTGLPNYNCIPVLGPNNTIKSSIMAIPYLKGNDKFCDDDESYFHRLEIPTKHNDMCKGKSTFKVIKEHADFKSFVYGNKIENRKVSFTLVKSKPVSSFVMVLDVSGSMEFPELQPECKRIDRMKQSAIRWIKYDVRDNTSVGLVKFSSDVVELMQLTPVNNATKNVFITNLEKLKADGGTCLGDALRGGLTVLKKGGVTEGGTMIFLTDGQHDCGRNPTINDVLPEIVAQGVRVVTIAFGKLADENIIRLADETNGKAYFIPDCTGPEAINSAMQGSLTYQPSVPSNEMDVIIYEGTFIGKSNITFEFTVDNMIGKDLNIQMEFSQNTGVTIMIPDSVTNFTEPNGVFHYTYDQMASGTYQGSYQTLKNDTVGFVSVKVTAKAISDSIPIMTKCWTSARNSKVDMGSQGAKVYVVAEVLQGTNPVIGAKVMAYIEREGVDAPLELSLLDSGADPDSKANDGIYARYFTTFDPTPNSMRYTLKCQVESTEDSKINQGFIDRNKQKSLPIKPTAGIPLCCGSNSLRADSILTSTGAFQRSSAGGAIEISNGDKASYPPGAVSDLRGSGSEDPNYFSLSFTSQGLVLDTGLANGIRIFYTTNATEIIDESNISPNLPFLQGSAVENVDSLLVQEAGKPVEIRIKKDGFDVGQTFFFRLRTFGNNANSWSNIANVYVNSVQDSNSGGKVGEFNAWIMNTFVICLNLIIFFA